MQAFGIVNSIDDFPLSWKVHVFVDYIMEPFFTEHVINLAV